MMQYIKMWHFGAIKLTINNIRGMLQILRNTEVTSAYQTECKLEIHIYFLFNSVKPLV